VDFDTTALKKGDKAVSEVGEKLNKLGGLLTGGIVALGLTEFVKGLIETGTESVRMSKRLGIGVGELEQWGFIANQSGVDTESLNTGLRFLSKNLFEANSAGGEAAATFRTLGVATKDAQGHSRKTTDVLTDLAGSFEGIDDPAKKVNLAMKIFGRSGIEMVPILNKGKAGIEELRQKFEKLGGGFGEDGVKAAREASMAIKDFNFVLLALKGRIAVEVLPVLTSLMMKGSELALAVVNLTKNTEFFKAALVTMGIVAAYVLGGLELGFLLPKAAIVALALLIDDLIVLFEGGDSVIGEFIDSMFGVGASAKFVEALRAVWQGLSQDIGFVLDQLKWFLGHIDDVKEAWGIFTKDVGRLMSGGKAEHAGGADGFGSVVAQGTQPAKREGTGLFSDFAAMGADHVNAVASDVSKPNTGVPSYLLRAPAEIPIGPPVSGTGTSVQQNTTVNIPITTTGDPKQIGTIAKDAARAVFDEQLRAAHAAGTEG